jgi:AraC-like DNA-binding protein
MKARRVQSSSPPEAAHTLPAVHVLHLSELLLRWQIPNAEFLSPLGLSAAELTQPGARVSLAQARQLCERAHALTGEPGLGIYLGLQMRISAYGYLGFAAMAAGTLREAIELGSRFAPTRTTAVSLGLEVESDLASVVIAEQTPLGSIRETLIFALLFGLSQIGSALTGRELWGRMELAFPVPNYFHRFAHIGRGAIVFGQPRHRLVFDATLLELPLVMADPVALQLAQKQCEQELDALGYGGPLLARVRELLLHPGGGFLTQKELARRLCLSVRTLKRRLSESGLSYSALLDEQRRNRALLLLRNGELSAEAVAERLGYSDAANFTRAFRRWTGTTPRRYRKNAPPKNVS